MEAVLGSGECDHVLEGEARVGGQEHFYLEPNAAIVIPKEMDEIESYASTQVRVAAARDCGPSRRLQSDPAANSDCE